MKNIYKSKREQELLKIYELKKDEVLKSYKKGFTLGAICRRIHNDLSTVLYILKKLRIPKKELYKIYEKQTIMTEVYSSDLILKTEKYYIDKFFPDPEDENMTTVYYKKWEIDLKKLKKQRENCSHSIKHIKCANCGKILGDATKT